jgi:hypothetical protein
MKILIVGVLLLLSLVSVQGQTGAPCANFQQLIKETYTFKPSKLSNSERERKSEAMDRVWNLVKANQAEMLPCLRAALQDPKADRFFLFDGSNLLVSLDPTNESKAIQIQSYATVDLADVDLRVWVVVLANRALEDLNTTSAAARWLEYREASYFIPEHVFSVGPLEGALFLYGTMPESRATPALAKIASDSSHRGRAYAIRLLMDQATPESLQVLRNLDPKGLTQNQKKGLEAFFAKPRVVIARKEPKTSRAEFLPAFEQLADGNWERFLDLVEKVSDGEKDVVAVMKSEDLPLLRRVRRRVIANGSPHAIEYYLSFTEILRTLMMKYELAS